MIIKILRSGAQLYILGMSPRVRKLEISVNIDASSLKFGMEHPLVHQLRFRKSQFEGPCEDHVLAINWLFLGKGDYGIQQKCEIWYGEYWGTLIMIQEKPI